MKFILSLLIILFFSVSVMANITETAVDISREKRLGDHPYWHTLMHFKTSVFGQERSLVDDPRFFFAENGRTDMQAELEATIHAIMQPADEPNIHPQCRFPARTAWLKEQLPILHHNSPTPLCPDFEEVARQINPNKASVVFPSYNMSGPGSMFGHTMIRLESENSSSLMGYAVTYAAGAEGAGALAYVVKGIFGGFKGHYTVLPYYEKLNEYEAIELRDVWEYHLNLTPDEVWRMYLHIWEMSSIAQDYYFFDENCAYNLLFFLEAAREGNVLTDGYIWVIPIDTVRTITENQMVSEINFRPSYGRRMEAIARSISKAAVDLARDIADGKKTAESVKTSGLPERQQVAALDLASELVRYNFQGATPAEVEVYKERSLNVSMARAGYNRRNNYHISRPHRPETGHRGSRAEVGAGYGDGSFFEFGMRPTFHSFIDNPIGYLESSNIDGANIKFRYWGDTGKFNLHSFTLLDVAMLTDITSFFAAPSWRAAVGVEDRSILADRTLMTGYLNVSGGAAYFPAEDTMLWVMAKGEIQTAGRFSNNISAGFGVSGGVMYSTGSFGKFLSEGSYLVYSDSADHQEGNLSLRYAVYPHINHAIVGGATFMQRNKIYGQEFSLSYMRHF